jgi:hypothetical protein
MAEPTVDVRELLARNPSKIWDMPPEELNKMQHVDLLTARKSAPPDLQNKFAAAEHRAFAREFTSDNPLAALPLAVMALGYQPYKMLQGDSRSEPSLNQAMQGIAGIGDGLSEYAQMKARAVTDLLSKL